MDSDGEYVYVPAWGASISAVNLQTGQARWIWGTGDTSGFRSGSNGVRVHGDTVYATVWHYMNPLGGLSEFWLVALDRNTGDELWRKVFPPYTSGVAVEGSPAVHQDLVIFTSAGGFQHAVNRFTTELVWQFTPNPEQGTGSQTELYDGVVYHDGGDRHIYALKAATGHMVWKSPVPNVSAYDLLVTERRVYVPSGGVPISVLDRKTGANVATFSDPTRRSSVNGLFPTGGTYANGRVFFGTSSGAACFREP